LFDTRVKKKDKDIQPGQSESLITIKTASKDPRNNTYHHDHCLRGIQTQGLDPKERLWTGNSDRVIKSLKQRKRASEHDRMHSKAKLHDKYNGDVDDADIEVDSYTETDISLDPAYTSEEGGGSDNDVGESIFSRPREETGTDTEFAAGSAENGYNSDATFENDINRLDRFIDDVTDDEYDAGPEETGAMVWRHIAFHIIQNPAPRPNILLAKITLLHTKGEDRKPRV
jgi:hypothetical protein